MKTTKEILLWMRRFGHTWNPAYPNLQNIDEGRVLMMNGSERDAKDMIASWQKLDSNVAMLVAAFHGRELDPDGEIGPASKAVMDFKRCGMTDYAPPPDASFDFGDPDLNAAIQSYQEYKHGSPPVPPEIVAMGTGSWLSCDPQRQGVNSTRVNMATRGFSSHQRNLMPQVVEMCVACEAETGHAVRYIMDGDPKECEKSVTAKNIPGGVIGYCYFPIPNTCDQTIVSVIDNSFNADAYTLADLFEHEWEGHGNGHEHSSGGPNNNRMNPSIGRPTVKPTWRGDKQEIIHRKYFGGVSLPPPGDPIPDVPQSPELIGDIFAEQGPNGTAIRGVVGVTVREGQKPGTFRQIIVPTGVPGNFRFAPASLD